MRDLHNNINIARAISPVSVSDDTAQVSQIIDTRDYGSTEFVVTIGSVADADATFAALLEEGNESDLSDATAVADLDLLGTEALAGFQFDDDNEVRRIGYAGNLRYVRLTITPANNASGAVIGAVAVQGNPRHAPVA